MMMTIVTLVGAIDGLIGVYCFHVVLVRWALGRCNVDDVGRMPTRRDQRHQYIRRVY